MKKVVVGICQRKNAKGESEYLLVRTKTDYAMYFSYFQPAGGKQESGETDEQTLIREFEEELGVEVKPVKKIAEGEGDVPGYIVSWWECELPNENFKIKENEIAEASFLNEEQIRNSQVWPATKKFFEDHIFRQEDRELKFR